jgi:hypothetical protein
MARAGQFLDRGGAIKWHRVSDRVYPGWGMVLDVFSMHERRGWRRDLAKHLGIPPSNLSRLLEKANLPNYEYYLGIVGFLESRGARIVIPITASKIAAVGESGGAAPEAKSPQ